MGISAGEVATASDVRNLAKIFCENQTFTRVMTAGSGDVAYTGYGFTPKALIVSAFVNTGAIRALNFGKFASTHDVILQSLSDTLNIGTQEFSSSLLFNLHRENTPSSGYYASIGQFASVKSLDADGFTLTWGNPAGGLVATADLSILAIGNSV